MSQPSPQALILARLREKAEVARSSGADGAYDRYEQLLGRFLSVFPEAASELDKPGPSNQKRATAAAGRGK